ncbi:MBL fold metallo-hydrolase [Rhizobium sp. CNPSo 4039]|uniref:MBL fold metallo-hydrolase n=1 Tax=Rhizobium sp. CNPSo 4039 TaxID=3021409 RepID=UPI0025512AD3|nr:MBL fold metallo-hydrolase [Rhizobium sp. CNPSo 4039]MDK4715337.1 MBL fold metallo-hydrolase [Rhizobium sp. CNPSo 4039]
MDDQLHLSDSDVIEVENEDGTRKICDDVAYLKLSIVNAVFLGRPVPDSSWLLIDTGLPSSQDRILAAAARRFGATSRPAAIIMTHGHIDHAGSVERLAAFWDVQVYAHPLEHPYLDGRASYPPADPWVGGGSFALMSPLLPRGPSNLGSLLQSLPADGTVPFASEWSWLHTPGHTPGHISLWRESDRTLLAGDAVITTGQESVYDVVTQAPRLHGPPRYLTIDWQASEQSAKQIASLKPERLISGHGPALGGAGLRAALDTLATNFWDIAVPPDGRYVGHPARATDGTAYCRP